MTTVQLEAPGNVATFPAIAPGHRLAPVAIGGPGQGRHVVYGACPDFCKTNHVAEWVHFLEDVNHTGEEFAVHVQSFFNGGKPVHTVTVAVGCDSMSNDPHMRAAHVIVGDKGSIDAYQTPDMANELADDLRKLADKLDEAARTARLHNQHEVSAEVA